MFYQNDSTAPIDFQKYACTFASCLYAKGRILKVGVSIQEAIGLWHGARRLGIISGDLNRDGDFDDPGEAVIQSYGKLFHYCGIPLREVPIESLGLPTGLDRAKVKRILPVKEALDPSKYFVIEAWHWKITHFVVGDGTGKKPVEYDPIKNGSLTVQNGKCETIRVFEIVKPLLA